MGELQAPRRASFPGGRRRAVQGRLAIAVGDEFNAGDGGQSEGFRRPVKSSSRAKQASEARRAAAPLFHPLAYRGVVAGWSLEHREQWGRRANALEDAGLAWRDAEAQAFVEVWHRVRRSDTPKATAPATRERADDS